MPFGSNTCLQNQSLNPIVSVPYVPQRHQLFPRDEVRKRNLMSKHPVVEQKVSFQLVFGNRDPQRTLMLFLQ